MIFIFLKDKFEIQNKRKKNNKKRISIKYEYIKVLSETV